MFKAVFGKSKTVPHPGAVAMGWQQIHADAVVLQLSMRRFQEVGCTQEISNDESWTLIQAANALGKLIQISEQAIREERLNQIDRNIQIL